MSSVRVTSSGTGVRFNVRVQPRASRTEVAGTQGDAVRIRVAAPPVEGAANAELVGFIAKRLGVAKSAVRILKGDRGRDKTVEVEGVSAARVQELLP